jgi:hypothetical protein
MASDLIMSVYFGLIRLPHTESTQSETQLMGNETQHQQSHRQIFKNLNKSVISRTKSKHSKALLFSLYMFDKCKKPEQKNLMQVYIQR